MDEEVVDLSIIDSLTVFTMNAFIARKTGAVIEVNIVVAHTTVLAWVAETFVGFYEGMNNACKKRKFI